MQKVKWYLQLSRPRFWVYTFGPFLLGVAAAYSQSFTLDYVFLVLLGLYFLFPANLLIYGVNDLFDYETDKHNPKKKAYETLIAPTNRREFRSILLLITIPFLTAISFILWKNTNLIALWSLVGFLFFGIGYSAPPIRAKVRPFLDSFFNILYIFPGLLSYATITEQWTPWPIILAATCWVMAMHAFSAIPDIESDKKAGINTIATKLQKNGTLMFCFLCYVIAAIATLHYLGIVAVTGLVVYLTMLFLAKKTNSDKELFAIYKAFPYVNMTYGFFLFWYIIL